nr:helix-turn-helix transcriptional regulator [uncultured Phocaeicola sp.]
MRESTLSEFAEILRNRRKELNLTQEELAEKVGKKRAYIARIEKGETYMQLSSFISISQALGIKLKTEY